MNIKIARIKKGLTQRQLRIKARISPCKLVQIEKGNYSNVTYDQMVRIAEVLDATPQELFFQD